MNEDVKNFTYLNELIRSTENDITLEYDIKMNRDEFDQFPEGIVIDIDDLTIDGNGHSIDADEITRIFKITGKNIKIKNITLKNGYSTDCGGAIANTGSATITKSALKWNTSDIDGGAIYNDIGGKTTIIDTEIENNLANIDGGGVFNWGTLRMINSNLNWNKSQMDAGALHNGGMTYKSSISKHKLKDEKDILLNNAVAFIENCDITGNVGRNSCGAVLNWGRLQVKDSMINHNLTEKRGGAINNQRSASVILENAIIRNNVSNKNGGGIYNLGNVKVNKSTFYDNFAKNNGAGVFNRQTMTITDTKFLNNTSTKNGGAINNESGTVTLIDTRLHRNKAQYGAAIANKGQMTVKKTDMFNNNAENGAGMANIGQISIKKVIFFRNRAEHLGGGILNFGQMNIIGAVMRNNMAKCGGAIANNGQISMEKTLLQDSHANKSGAGIYNNKGIVSLNKTTITKNVAKECGGGIHTCSGEIIEDNCKIEDNTPNNVHKK
ncbi:MAG: hypothetical protein Q4Q22_02050 [Methanosphaera sp.]|nr:hypothetical protein [Methanosphaera sp.]